LGLLNNKIGQDVYASKISQFMGINKQTLLEQISKVARQSSKKLKTEEFKSVVAAINGGKSCLGMGGSSSIKLLRAEEALIAYIINNPESANNIFLRLPIQDICTEFNRKIYTLLYEKFKKTGNITFQGLCAELNEEEKQKICAYLAYESLRKSCFEDAQNYIETIVYEKEKAKIRNLNKVTDNEIVSFVAKLRQLKR